MPQVTVADVTDVTKMKDIDILRWISVHERSLQESGMKDYWKAIKEDIKILKTEYDIRHPEIVLLRDIRFTLEQIYNDKHRPNTGPK